MITNRVLLVAVLPPEAIPPFRVYMDFTNLEGRMKTPNTEKEFLSTQNMAALLDLSIDGLKQIKAKHFTEGVHFVKISPSQTSKVLWNREVVLNWFQNRHNPDEHTRFCASYLQSLGRSSPPRQRAS